MHTDEAVHAVKFGALLETGVYRYDRNEYHGPTLNYLTLLPSWLQSATAFSDVSETTLRIVPVTFGLALLLLPLLLKNFGETPMITAVLLTAVSPAMVFYSRYYIQEMLLVCFTFGLIVAGWRLLTSGRMSWAICAGVCAGLMAATKETWVIPLAVIVSGAIGVLVLRRREGRAPLRMSAGHLAAGAASGVAVSVLFYSSFFTHWEGLTDALLAYGTYFGRAGTDGAHIHPWYYYLQILAFWRSDQGPVWSEALILALGIAGFWSVVKEKPESESPAVDLRRFLALYAILIMVVYSAVPYKTPWVMLGGLHGFIVVAGIGAEACLQWLKKSPLKRACWIVAAALVAHLAWQAYLASYRFYEDPINPYVYAHPRDDVRLVAEVVRNAAANAPSGLSTPVQVIVPGDDYWPLPWYLRSLPNTGWWNAVGSGFVPTPVMLATPEVEPALLRAVYERLPPGQTNLYVPLFDRPMYLRPGQEVCGYVTLDLRDRMRMEGR
jgi:uncharacterized protein (TIGR03663 family)